jgi:lauroyl/myristoyl acyltransferase
VIVFYWLWRLGMFLIAATPRRISLWMADVLGMACYYTMPLRRRVARENFAHVLSKPIDDVRVGWVTRRSFRNFARQLRDVMIYPSMSVKELDERVTIVTPAHFEEALSRGTGAIIVSAHFGNNDLTSAVMAMHFKPFTLISETLRPPQLMQHLVEIRAKRKVMLYPYETAPRKIIEALKRNEMTAFLVDFGITHHFDIATVPVEFFGTPTQFPAGPAQLALLTGAALLIGHVNVGEDGHMSIHTTSPLFVARGKDRQKIFQETMQEVARRMERFISEHPEEWYIFRPMWSVEEKRARQIQHASLSAAKNENE